MTLDPRSVALLNNIPLGDGPVFFVDVDEVVLEFLEPYRAFLRSRDMTLGSDAFRLHGNVRHADGSLVHDDTVSEDIDRFFAEQGTWQTIVPGAKEGLKTLRSHGDVILLTAMWHLHFDARQTHLVSLGIDAPLVTTEGSKGRAIKHAAGAKRVAFIDDMPRNHEDVLEHVPHAASIHFMANDALTHLLPPLPDATARARTWPEIVDIALEGVR